MTDPSFDSYLDAQTARHFQAGPSGLTQMTLERRLVGPADADGCVPGVLLDVDVYADDGGAYVECVRGLDDESGDWPVPPRRQPWLESLCELTSGEQEEAQQRVADERAEDGR